MPYFCLFEDTTHTLTRVEIRAVQPEPVIEAPGWIPRYVARLGEDEGALLGAQIAMGRMEHEYAACKRSRGIYAVPYAQARSWLQRQFESAQAPRRAHAAPHPGMAPARRAYWIRILSGVAAFAMFMIYVWINVAATFIWVGYLAVTHKERSPLRAMAESAVLFTILDWRRPIHGLVRIALGRQ